jgi:uncharacterized protein YkwD
LPNCPPPSWVRHLPVLLLIGLACNTAPTAPALPGGTTTGGGTAGTGGTPPSGSGAAVSASLLEQLSLERINRARLRPGAEAAAAGIAIDEGIPGQLNANPRQAVALNASLNRAARGHSQDMINRDFFAHNTPEGVTPFARMTSAGYAFITAGENLAWRGTTGPVNEVQTVEDQHLDLFVDSGVAGRGHRLTMLNAGFREVGIGIIRGEFTETGTTYDSIMQTQDFGTAPSGNTFVLGAVYNDVNSNGQYDFGEGAANTSVSLNGVVKLTNAGGGYSFEVTQSGTYNLSFPASGRGQQVSIGAGTANIKVDLVSGNSVVVNLGLGPLN